MKLRRSMKPRSIPTHHLCVPRHTHPLHSATATPFDARRTHSILLVLCLVMGVVTAHAGPHLRVRGVLRLDCHAGRRHGRLVVEGRTLDDAGRPVGGHPVSIGASSGSVKTALSDPAPCTGIVTREKPVAKDGSI